MDTSKISKCLHHNRIHKAVATIFLNTLQKHYQLPIFGILKMSGHFHQKGLYQHVETLVFILSACQMTSIPNFFFEIL